MFLLQLSAFINVLVLICGQSSRESTYRTLRKHILTGYDPNAAPVIRPLEPISVQIDLEPLHITELNENTGIMTMEVWLSSSWSDHRLTWDPRNFSNLDILRLPPEDVWKPDIATWNGRGRHIRPWQPMNALVYSNGLVMWIPPATLRVICQAMDYTGFPKDIKKCRVILGSWSSDASAIDFHTTNGSVSTEDFFAASNPHWRLANVTKQRKVNFFGYSDEKIYISVQYEFELQRANVPSSSLCSVPDRVARILILCMFFVSSPVKKFLLGCTSMLVLTILATTVTSTLPSPAAAPAALSQITLALVLCIVAIIAEVIVDQLTNCGLPHPGFLDIVATTRWRFLFDPCGRGLRNPGSKAESQWHLLANMFEFFVFVIIAVSLFAT